MKQAVVALRVKQVRSRSWACAVNVRSRVAVAASICVVSAGYTCAVIVRDSARDVLQFYARRENVRANARQAIDFD